jgi:transposase
MLSKEIFLDMLQLGEGWEPSDIQFSQTAGTLTIAVKPGETVWTRQECPKCRNRKVAPEEVSKKQVWRHLDGFNHKTLIECDLPRAKCADCGHRFSLRPLWQGRTRHFTKNFEAFALSVIRETTVRGASRVLSESDQRLWRMLFAYVEGVRGELSSVAIGILHREWSKTAKQNG